LAIWAYNEAAKIRRSCTKRKEKFWFFFTDLYSLARIWGFGSRFWAGSLQQRLGLHVGKKGRKGMMNKGLAGVLFLAIAVFSQGCATHIKGPATAPKPAKVKLSTFKNVVMTPVALADAYAKSGANKKAQKKINEVMTVEMKKVFPSVKVVTDTAKVAKKGTLLIEPNIKEIKFIGGFARYMAGPFAGSSAVLMQVKFKNLETGAVVADPIFYRKASAFAGGMYGSADNRMLSEVVRDAVDYTRDNK